MWETKGFIDEHNQFTGKAESINGSQVACLNAMRESIAFKEMTVERLLEVKFTTEYVNSTVCTCGVGDDLLSISRHAMGCPRRLDD